MGSETRHARAGVPQVQAGPGDSLAGGALQGVPSQGQVCLRADPVEGGLGQRVCGEAKGAANIKRGHPDGTSCWQTRCRASSQAGAIQSIARATTSLQSIARATPPPSYSTTTPRHTSHLQPNTT